MVKSVRISGEKMLKELVSACIVLCALSETLSAGKTPGVTVSEIEIEGVISLSGPVSPARRISLCGPPQAIEHDHRPAEGHQVAFFFSQLGTPDEMLVSI